MFDLAGDTSVWARNDERKRRVHMEGTRNIVTAALARHAKRLVHTSTAGTLREHGDEITEDTPSTGAAR